MRQQGGTIVIGSLLYRLVPARLILKEVVDKTGLTSVGRLLRVTQMCVRVCFGQDSPVSCLSNQPSIVLQKGRSMKMRINDYAPLRYF